MLIFVTLKDSLRTSINNGSNIYILIPNITNKSEKNKSTNIIMTSVFSSLTLPNGAVIPNRIAKAATQENLADIDQNPSKELIQLYKTWSEGGAGLSISGHIMIDRRAVGGPADVVLEDDTNLEIFKEWAKAGTVGGNQFWLQLNHPGKQIMANLGQPALAPSEVPVTEKNASLFAPPQEITEAQLQEVIDRFQYTSQLAERAGFTGVQIHAAHGYLLSQFLSPISNIRDDKWGGSLENRARLLFEVVKKVRSVVSPKFCVAVKINSADFQRGGFAPDDAKWVVQQLNNMDVDLVELSGGSYDSPAMFGEAKHVESSSTEIKSERTLAREAYFLSFAEDIAKVYHTYYGDWRYQPKRGARASHEGWCIHGRHSHCSHIEARPSKRFQK